MLVFVVHVLCLLAVPMAAEDEEDSRVTAASEWRANDGRYFFRFGTSHGQQREERRDGQGNVVGSYAYVDADGQAVRVHYRAGLQGFQIVDSHTYQMLTQDMEQELPNEDDDDIFPVTLYWTPVPSHQHSQTTVIGPNNYYYYIY